MALDVAKEELKQNLLEIQSFNDEQINFYRDYESTYYHQILDVVNFIRNHEMEVLIDCFYDLKDYIKDFKNLFLGLVHYEEYNLTSQRKSNFFSTIAKLKQIVDQYQKEFSNTESILKTYIEKIETIEGRIQEKESYLEEKNKEVLQIKENAENAEKAFKENHKLHEARKYWANKSKAHGWKAIVSFITFILILIGIGYITWDRIEQSKFEDRTKAPTKIFIDQNSSQLKINPEILEYQKILEKHELLRYIQYLFLLSLVIWISRLLLKITFSNLHLKEEAHEKETMILTYLALINEGAGLQGDDRKLILEAIFRT